MQIASNHNRALWILRPFGCILHIAEHTSARLESHDFPERTLIRADAGAGTSKWQETILRYKSAAL